MKIGSDLRLLISISVGLVVYAVSVNLARDYLFDIYIWHPQMQSLILGFFVIVAILAVLLVYSMLLSNSTRSNGSNHQSKLVAWSAILTILVVSLFLGYYSINIIAQNTTATWEEIEVPPPPYINNDFVKMYESDKMVGCENCDLISSSVFTIKGDRKRTLNMPPQSQVTFDVDVPSEAKLAFSIALAPAVWQIGYGDGVQFSIKLDRDRVVTNIFSAYIDPKNLVNDRDWINYEVDLSAWGGQEVTLIFATSPGPNNDDRYDWAGWGEPRIEPKVYYNFLDNLNNAGVELTNPEFGQVNKSTLIINKDLRDILFQHPSSRVIYTLTLTSKPKLKFGLGMSPDAWEKSDGVEYNLYVRRLSDPNKLTRVFQRIIDPKNNPDDRLWFDEHVDLSEFGGEEVEIIFEALPGPANNYDFDWGGWSNPVLIDETPPGTTGAIAPGVLRLYP